MITITLDLKKKKLSVRQKFQLDGEVLLDKFKNKITCWWKDMSGEIFIVRNNSAVNENALTKKMACNWSVMGKRWTQMQRN